MRVAGYSLLALLVLVLAPPAGLPVNRLLADDAVAIAIAHEAVGGMAA